MFFWNGPRRVGRGVMCLLFVCLAFHPASIVMRSAAAQGRTTSSIAAHVEAGEFGPARAAADGLSAEGRDQALAIIAAAQAKSGARDASFATAYDIRSDQARSGTYRQLGSSGPITPPSFPARYQCRHAKAHRLQRIGRELCAKGSQCRRQGFAIIFQPGFDLLRCVSGDGQRLHAGSPWI